MKPLHPAAQWAKTARLSPSDVDCITTVMLKILDGKCQMNDEQRHAYILIYDVSKEQAGALFGPSVHTAIHTARSSNQAGISERIHQLRLDAEAQIPKPVMKSFKARVREEVPELETGGA